ncbi:hypothetical protein [Actinacidiphila epipremni]|uniref:DUF624 domain-containing protein n=1 Tax=Actinacidiphila epipremni TaxID=2053013 RepID=A0ABX0ZVQ1_9ACTN|nr:hypothetical protein [Actinacidiphila epipremni]NJP46737.1 hypothetical protein [Actinacidiphila epipremni]
MTSPTTTPRGTTRRLPTNVSYGSWELIWSHVHQVLVVNAGFAAGCLPLLAALAATHQPWRHPVPFTLLWLCVGPALAGVFGYLERAADDGAGSARAVELPRAYRRLFRRAAALWTPYALLAAVCGTDAVLLRHTAVGLAVCPALALVAVGSALSGVHAMVLAATAAPGRPLSPADYLAAPYGLLRRPASALANLVVLVAAAALVDRAPLLGLAVLPGCALYVVWRNALSGLRSAPGGPSPRSRRPRTSARSSRAGAPR